MLLVRFRARIKPRTILPRTRKLILRDDFDNDGSSKVEAVTTLPLRIPKNVEVVDANRIGEF